MNLEISSNSSTLFNNILKPQAEDDGGGGGGGGGEDLASSPSPTSTTTTADDNLDLEVTEEDYYLELEIFEGGGQLSDAATAADQDHHQQQQQQVVVVIKSWENISGGEEKYQEKDHDDEEAVIIPTTARNYYYAHHHDRDIDHQRQHPVTSPAAEADQEEAGSLFSFDLSSSLSLSFHHHHHKNQEIYVEEDDQLLAETDDFNGEAVYVVISSTTTSESMDALQWALNNVNNKKSGSSSSTTIFLVHVFPRIHHIPTPLGMMRVDQVNAEQKDKYMVEQRGKRRQFLNKYMSACSSSSSNNAVVETILIESEMEAEAILDLIPILNISKLVIGTNQPILRKLRRSNKAVTGSIVGQILREAPASCEVSVICEGKQVSDPFANSPPPRPCRQANSFPFGCGACFKASKAYQ